MDEEMDVKLYEEYFFDDEEAKEEYEGDIYTEQAVDEELDEDHISLEEAAFMHGYIDAL